MSCPFCTNLSSLELVYSDDVAAVALHDDWAVRGHAMVIAKQHVENLSELAAPDRFMRVYREAERALLRLTGAGRAIILKLGIATPHLHLHIYPVSAALDRAAVMDVIDGRAGVARDAAFVAAVRSALDSALASE
ncbi:MAG TPA: HIT domain-containing protein [Thermoanaerobaculia bacterium]|nr:HIT domain-containing protein [Thermoanaerobaculia bacterium]